MIGLSKKFSLYDHLQDIVPNVSLEMEAIFCESSDSEKENEQKIRKKENANSNMQKEHEKQNANQPKFEINGNIVENSFLVGHEMNNKFLICRDCLDSNLVKKTFIDMLDISNHKRTNIYKHHELFECVGASINLDLSFMILTFKKGIISDDLKRETRYQSFIVELQNNNILKQFTDETSFYQRIFFLPNHRSTKYEEILSILDQNFIRVNRLNFKNQSQHKQKIKIMTKQTTSYVICEKFIWYHFSPKSQRLFVLKPVPTRNEELLCYSFENKKTQVILDMSLKILKTPFSIEPKSSDVHKSYCNHKSNMHGLCSPNSTYNFQIVKISTGAFCLCRQYPENFENESILISIWILHRREQINLQIPYSKLSSKPSGKLKAFFGSIYEILVIYIPGYFLQFLDCTRLHETTIPMIFHEKEFLDPIQKTSLLLSPIYSEVDTLNRIQSENDLIDNYSGTIYSYTISKEYLASLLPKYHQLSEFIVHVFLTHMIDEKMLEEMKPSLLDETISFSSQFFQEYIFASTFQNLRKKNFQKNLRNFRKIILSIIPISTINNLEYDKHELFDFMRNSIAEYELLRIQDTFTTISESRTIRLSLTNLQESFLQFTSKNIASNEEKALMVFPEIQASPLTKKKKKKVEQNLIKSKVSLSFFETLIQDHISKYLVNIKNRKTIIKQLLKFYLETITNEIENLFKFLFDNLIEQYFGDEQSGLHFIPEPIPSIENSMKENENSKNNFNYLNNQSVSKELLFFKQKKMFGLMERLYISLEKFYLPFPKNFHPVFCRLGFYCLSKQLFAHYITNNMFQIDIRFIPEITPFLDLKTKQDQELKNRLICLLNGTEEIIEVSEAFEVDEKYLLEYYSNSISDQIINKLNSQKSQNVHPFSRSTDSHEIIRFEPLTIVKNSIQEIDTKSQIHSIKFLLSKMEKIYQKNLIEPEKLLNLEQIEKK
ncbi:gamma-secretase-activating protein [Anaeramoeba ignava]|uniref:Gamma-secretase-activating protein n=1 Tax=Anaeramoeba ignava TaxID=1746090 RepID=A0A9Q0LAR2_ANAIG|nr:gamma-secretase-activating protein [Anaeramoeba ignava]